MSYRPSQRNNLKKAIKNIDYNYNHILEFGVFDGTTLKIIKDRINSIKDNFKESPKIYGFDSFKGFPEDWKNKKGKLIAKKSTFKTSILHMDDVVIYDGYFIDTIPKYLKKAKKISFLHIDCDIYINSTDFRNVKWLYYY